MRTRGFWGVISPLLKFIIVVMSIVAVLGCSKKAPTDSEPDGITSLTVTPISGPPLTVVDVVGIDQSKIDLSNAYALFNGMVSGLFVQDNGIIQITLPVAVDTATMWVDTTNTSWSLAIVEAASGDTIAYGDDVFSMTFLPSSPGSTAQILADWTSISQSLHTISDAVSTGPGVEDMLMSSLLLAFDSLLIGSDSMSLSYALVDMSANNQEAKNLVDALLGSSGVVEHSQKYAELFSMLADSAASKSTYSKNLSSESTLLTDNNLAWRMQMYVVVKEFGNTVVAPTAAAYGRVFGAVGLIASYPGLSMAQVVGAVLSIIDFILNKLIVALMPAQIDSLTVEFVSDTINIGDYTDATMMLYVSNDPPPITFMDFVGQLLNAIGLHRTLSPPPALDAFTDFVMDLTNYTMGLVRDGMSIYTGAHPEFIYDINITSMPDMEWEAQLTDTRFVNLESFTPDILNPIMGEVNWEPIETFGEGRVRVQTTTGPEATVVDLPMGFSYHGGAFGNDVGGSPTYSVWVLPELVLEVTFAPDISIESSSTLSVRAGYYDSVGDPDWSSNILIELDVSGGSADFTSGYTDAFGEFATEISLDESSEIVTVIVKATGEMDVSAEETVSADNLTSVFIPIDPGAAYLHLCDDAAGSSLSLYLASYGISPGDLIRFKGQGNYTAGGGFTRGSLTAVFSANSTLLGPNELHRVPGAINANSPVFTDPTFNCGGEQTDIPEDFKCDDVIILQVPAGAVYLFIAAEDIKYEDNYSNGSDFGVFITRLP